MSFGFEQATAALRDAAARRSACTAADAVSSASRAGASAAMAWVRPSS